MFKRIDHTAIVVKDRNKSVQFYEDLMGFKKYHEHDVPIEAVEKIVYLKLGDTVLELIHMPNVNGGDTQSFHFCLLSDDFEEDYQRLVAAGVTIITPPHLAGARAFGEEDWQRLVFSGPDGESIEVRG